MVTVLLDQVDGSQDDVVHIVTNSFYGVGQGFTGNGAKVFEARFHVGSSFPVLGNLFRAAIYNHSGTWGSGLPTGTPLAVSENRDATELVPDASGWVTFQFTGVNQFQTVAGQHYFIVFEYVDPDDPLYSTVHIYFTTQSSTFNGGSFVCFNSYNNINQWEVYGYGERLCFQLYGSLPFFSVMYNGNGATGGSVPVDSNTYNEGSVVTVATNSGNLVRTNYIFKGWSTSSSGTAPTYINNNNTITPATFIMSSSNIVLFAVWDLASNQTYTVIYNGNGNTGGSTPTDNNGPYQAGNTVTVLNQGSLTKSNHTFLGWSTDNTATSPLYTTSSTFTINCAIVLYAIWIPLRTVTYNGNGATSGSAPVDSNSPYIDGSSVVVMGQNTLLKTKHVFIGWSTDNTAFLAQYTPTSTFIITGGNVILYAVWRELCTITYEAGTGGSGSASVDVNSPYVAGSSVMVLGKGGLVHGGNYVFLGWYCSTDGSYYVEGSAFTIMEDVTLVAVWDPVPPIPFYVLYSGNGNTGGDVPVDRNAYAPNSYFTVLGSNTLTRACYVFLGWSTNSLADVADYLPDSRRVYVNPIILYAVWNYIGGGEHVVFVYLTVNVPFNGRYAGSVGSKETILRYVGVGNEAVLKVLSNLPNDVDCNAVVENLIIDGKNKPGVMGILLEDVSNCLVRNVTIMNCDVGIKVQLTGNRGVCSMGNRFEHIRLIHVKSGIVFEGAGGAKDFSGTTIDDVGISLEDQADLSDVGIKIGVNANLYCAFIKANVWLSKSLGTGLEVNGKLNYSLVNFAVEQDLGFNGCGVRINSGATVKDNQSFRLTALTLLTNKVVDNNNPSNNDIVIS